MIRLYMYRNVFEHFPEAYVTAKTEIWHPRDLIKSDHVWLFNPFFPRSPIYNKQN